MSRPPTFVKHNANALSPENVCRHAADHLRWHICQTINYDKKQHFKNFHLEMRRAATIHIETFSTQLLRDAMEVVKVCRRQQLKIANDRKVSYICNSICVVVKCSNKFLISICYARQEGGWADSIRICLVLSKCLFLRWRWAYIRLLFWLNLLESKLSGSSGLMKLIYYFFVECKKNIAELAL